MPRTPTPSGTPLAAVLLAVTLAVTLVGTLAGCGSDGASPSTSGADGGLAAIASRTLDGEISSAEPLADVYWRISGPRTVGVDARLDPGEGDDGDLVRLTKGPATPVAPCTRSDRCVVTPTRSGTQVVTWDLEAPEEDPGYVAVALHGDRDTRTILLAGPAITGDPRTGRLPYVGSVARMARILTDPAFDRVPVRPAGPLTRWTPRTLAALVYSRVPATYGFREVPGGIGFRAYGPVVTLVLQTGGTAATGCPAGYTCATEADLTYAWRPGAAVLLRQRDGYVVRVGVAQRRLAVRGPADFADDEVLGQLVALTADPELGPALSSDWAEVADEVDWAGRG